MNKVAVFIDGIDFYNGLKKIAFNLSIDYHIFAKKLCNEHRDLLRIYYYNKKYNQNNDKEKYQKQQRFISALEQTQYVQHNFERSIYDAKIKLVVNMLEFAHRDTYDTAILVSRSGSYVPAIESIKNLGKHTELVFFNDDVDALKTATDTYVPIDKDFLNACLFKG